MRRSELPSLDDLRAFEAVARLSSVRAAAEDLALTHGAISRRVSRLSEELGFPLFEKSGRGLQLTPAGEMLKVTVGRFFTEFAVAVDHLRGLGTEKNAVALSCEPSVATRWLIPRLASFQEACPDIAVHLSVGGGPVEFRRDRIVLAFRRLDFAIHETWQVRRLFAEQVGPVMNPKLIAAFAAGDYVALCSKTRPKAWQQWLSAHPTAAPPTQIQFYDHHFLTIEAASAGLGIAMSPFVLVCDDIERKRLVAPAGFYADGSYYGLLWMSDRELAGSAAVLAGWLQEQLLQTVSTTTRPRRRATKGTPR